MDEIKRKCIEAIRSLAPEKNFSVYVRSRSKSEIGDWIHVNRYCYLPDECDLSLIEDRKEAGVDIPVELHWRFVDEYLVGNRLIFGEDDKWYVDRWELVCDMQQFQDEIIKDFEDEEAEVLEFEVKEHAPGRDGWRNFDWPGRKPVRPDNCGIKPKKIREKWFNRVTEQWEIIEPKRRKK